MSQKQADEWYDRISRLDPPGYDDSGDEERTTGQEVPEFEEFEVEEEHLRYDRSYFRAQLRH